MKGRGAGEGATRFEEYLNLSKHREVERSPISIIYGFRVNRMQQNRLSLIFIIGLERFPSRRNKASFAGSDKTRARRSLRVCAPPVPLNRCVSFVSLSNKQTRTSLTRLYRRLKLLQSLRRVIVSLLTSRGNETRLHLAVISKDARLQTFPGNFRLSENSVTRWYECKVRR